MGKGLVVTEAESGYDVFGNPVLSLSLTFETLEDLKEYYKTHVQKLKKDAAE